MKYGMYIRLLWVSVCLSCSQVNKPGTVQDTVKKDSAVARVKPASSFSDTLIIKGPAAVFYYPDSLQDLAIKRITEPAIYNSSVHEMFYQMRNAKVVIHRYYPKLKIMEAKNIRYLFFLKEGLKNQCIDLNLYNDARGLFIFDGKQDVSLVDMTNIETALAFYFKNKANSK